MGGWVDGWTVDPPIGRWHSGWVDKWIPVGGRDKQTGTRWAHLRIVVAKCGSPGHARLSQRLGQAQPLLLKPAACHQRRIHAATQAPRQVVCGDSKAADHVAGEEHGIWLLRC